MSLSGFASRCPRCGQYGHLDCQPLPLETPSHNGPYRGKLPVRVIPPAVFGEDLKHGWGVSARRGHEAQSRLAAANRDPLRVYRSQRRAALLRGRTREAP
jgi:hypothetical protein